MMQLYDYFRSSASYRVRIALAYKGIQANLKEVHLVNNNGEQHQPDYLQLNPQGLVPTLVVDSFSLSQSLAIIDYLEQTHPNPPLFPKNIPQRSYAYNIALTIACEIHPLNNLRVLNYIKGNYSTDEEQITNWYHHWLKLGFDAIEENLDKHQSHDCYCIGDHISIADICLIPQVFNANRFEFSLAKYPRIGQVYDACMTMSCFEKTKPENN